MFIDTTGYRSSFISHDTAVSLRLISGTDTHPEGTFHIVVHDMHSHHQAVIPVQIRRHTTGPVKAAILGLDGCKLLSLFISWEDFNSPQLSNEDLDFFSLPTVDMIMNSFGPVMMQLNYYHPFPFNEQ